MARAKSRRTAKRTNGLFSWWPLALGVLLTPFALRAAAVSALTGPVLLWLLYPIALLITRPELGLPGTLADSLSQIMMYLQFPFEGLLAVWLVRKRGFLFAMTVVGGLHLAAFALLFVLSKMHG